MNTISVVNKQNNNQRTTCWRIIIITVRNIKDLRDCNKNGFISTHAWWAGQHWVQITGDWEGGMFNPGSGFSVHPFHHWICHRIWRQSTRYVNITYYIHHRGTITIQFYVSFTTNSKALWYFTILTLRLLPLRWRRRFVVIRGAKESELHFCIKQFSKLFCSCGRETFDNNETWSKLWGPCGKLGLPWRLQRVSESSQVSSKVCLQWSIRLRMESFAGVLSRRFSQ